MKTVRLLSAVLKTISLMAVAASLFFGWLFYVLYLKWIFRFENGRYFDPVEEVVYEEDSSILGIFSFVLLLFSVGIWLLASRIKSKREMNPTRGTVDDKSAGSGPTTS